MPIAPPAFSKQETAWHQTARFQFVPWVARLLGHGPLRGKSGALPAGNPDGLTAETVDALRTMMNRAVWKFLARDCGWRERYVVIDSRGGGETGHSRRRLWRSSSGSGLPPLRFTSGAVDLLLAAYNATHDEARFGDLVPPSGAESNGDLFLQHLVFRRFTGSADSPGLGACFHRGSWSRNPLNALLDVTSFDGPDTASPNWDRLAEPDVAAYFPWIGARIAEDWRARRKGFQDGIEAVANWFAGLTALNREWIGTAAGRPDLLIFLLEYLSGMAESADTDFQSFESTAASLTLQQRERIAIHWADFLKITETLETFHRNCVAVHPVDRSGPENCFLAARQEMAFSQTADILRTLRQRIRPAMS